MHGWQIVQHFSKNIRALIYHAESWRNDKPFSAQKLKFTCFDHSIFLPIRCPIRLSCQVFPSFSFISSPLLSYVTQNAVRPGERHYVPTEMAEGDCRLMIYHCTTIYNNVQDSLVLQKKIAPSGKICSLRSKFFAVRTNSLRTELTTIDKEGNVKMAELRPTHLKLQFYSCSMNFKNCCHFPVRWWYRFLLN